LPRSKPKALLWGPLERKLSKVSVGIFSEKSSDFVQDRQPICKVSVSRLARGFAPRFGKRIFKQFPAAIFLLGSALTRGRRDFARGQKISSP